jgi:hypothetical protein
VSQITNRPGWSAFRIARYAVLFLVVLYAGATAARLYGRKYYIFMPSYVRWATTPAPTVASRPTHIFFMVADHFEPDFDAARVKAWDARYRVMAARHHDADGRPPQHGWFYPGEQVRPEIFEELRSMVQAGLGEVELHYHHHYDTEATLRPKLEQAIADFKQYGFLETPDGATHFAFIHGNWDLDNSDGPANCGVSTEISLLSQLGSFADFTFPSIYFNAQPPSVNAIYAAKDDPGPKSYARQLPLSALRTPGAADMMIFEGPLLFAPSLSVRHLFLDLEDGQLHQAEPASPARVDRWVKADVHVAERPDWIFIKTWTHGITSQADAESVLGPEFESALTHLETKYNDGQHYVLHYVTAREAYNLARAAADGAQGEPEQYYDATIPRYVADGPRPLVASAGSARPRS